MVFPTLRPNALFKSMRAEAVANRRSRQVTRSWAKPPYVAFSVVVVEMTRVVAAFGVTDPTPRP